MWHSTDLPWKLMCAVYAKMIYDNVDGCCRNAGHLCWAAFEHEGSQDVTQSKSWFNSLVHGSFKPSSCESMFIFNLFKGI